MTPAHNPLFVFSESNLLAQIESGVFELGYYKVTFYTQNGLPAAVVTETLSDFYLYPSGGTLRDSNFNIVFYSTKFDTYKGFIPPHLKSTS
jgi:hypothetical protein